jgi:hypothetical protein
MHSASGAFLPDTDSRQETHINPDCIASGLGAKQVRCEEDLSKTNEEVRELIYIALQES